MPPAIRHILLLSILNPAVLVVGAWLGRRADQPQKLVIAGFIAGLAGLPAAWIAMRLGITDAGPRLLAGIFIAGAFVGAAAAWVAWRTKPGRSTGT